MKRTLWIAVLLLVPIRSIAACAPPSDVSTRVGLAHDFVYQFSPSEYQSARNLQSRAIIWNNQPGSAQGGADKLYFPRGVISSAYTSIARVPANPEAFGNTIVSSSCGDPRGGCPLSWFQAHHPNWVVLTHDQATPAYFFHDRTWIPLDISNPEVQAWIETNVFAPLLAAGYQSISFDNVTDQDAFDEEGVCSVAVRDFASGGTCAGHGGTWTQLYSGAVDHDAGFIANQLRWIANASNYIHKTGGACTFANVTYDASDLADSARLINAFDIWLDEPGFNGDANPSSCKSGGGQRYRLWDDNWRNKVDFITQLNSGTGPKAMVQTASMCPLPRVDRKVVEYAVASYLITKNSHTYLFPYFDNGSTYAAFVDDKPGGAWPELWWQHGRALGAYQIANGVYYRRFANGIALLNPSSATSASFDLANEVYRGFDSKRYAGRVSLPPVTGLLLKTDEIGTTR